MRDLFKGYYQPTEKEYEELWTKGTFVFDTNVLLGVYHFPQESRNAFLSILDKLGSRVWIPYHVALEFQRNRIRRIKDAGKELENLEKAIASARTLPTAVDQLELDKWGLGEINLKDPLQALTEALKKLQEAADAARRVLPNVGLKDETREKLSRIFAERVGQPPLKQEELEALIADGKARFENQIPPGYKDAAKDGSKFLDNGVFYERKYGDLIIWKQILQHVADAKLSHVVFVTGDQKDDWWSNDGAETIGPRPELVQEALRAMPTAGSFWMYSTEQFVVHAKKYLKTEVTQEAINQVRDASATYTVDVIPKFEIDRQRTREYLHASRLKRIEERAQLLAAIETWARALYPEAKVGKQFGPAIDLFVQTDAIRWGINATYVKIPSEDYWEQTVTRIKQQVVRYNLTHFTVVFANKAPRARKPPGFFALALAAIADIRELSLIYGGVGDSGFYVVSIGGELPPRTVPP